MKDRFAIEHDLLTLQPDLVPSDMFSLCSRYFNYRHKNGRIDHGIFAGVLMYDRLVKNRLIKKGKVGEKLLWEDWLDGQYAYAAATVAIHNMWFPQKEDFVAYAESNLEQLIGQAKISFQQAPLLFLLGLVDTLDPVKAYWQLSSALVLKNVSLCFSGEGSFSLRISKNLNFSVMAKKISDMEQWLSVRTVIKENQIKIKFID